MEIKSFNDRKSSVLRRCYNGSSMADNIAEALSRSQENGTLGDPANHELFTRVLMSISLTFIVHPYFPSTLAPLD